MAQKYEIVLDGLGVIPVKDRWMIHKSLKTFENYMTIFRKFRVQKFQKEIFEALNTYQFLAIVLPREHTKSETVGESYISYYLMRHPDRYAAVYSTTSGQASERIQNIQMTILAPFLRDGSPNFMRHFKPKHSNSWNKKEIHYRNRSKGTSGGAAGETRGTRYGDERPGLVEVDDPVPEQPGKDEHINRWYFETILSLGNETTQYVITGTPRRYGDLIMTMIEEGNEKGFHVIRYPAVFREPIRTLDDVLWPEKWLITKACCSNPRNECHESYGEISRIQTHVNNKKKTLGSLAWSRDWLCEPIPDGAAIFPSQLVQRALDPTIILQVPSYENSTRVSGVDPAASEDEKASGFTGIVTLEHTELIFCEQCNITYIYKEECDHKFMKVTRDTPILDLEFFTGEAYGIQYFTHQIMRIEAHHETYGTTMVGIENNSFQRHYENILLHREESFPAIGLYTGDDKHDLQKGIPSLRQPFETGEFRLPWGTTGVHTEEEIKYTRKQVTRFMKELRGFFIEKGKVHYSGLGHGDLVIALWKAWQALEELNLGTFTEIGSVTSPEHGSLLGGPKTLSRLQST